MRPKHFSQNAVIKSINRSTRCLRMMLADDLEKEMVIYCYLRLKMYRVDLEKINVFFSRLIRFVHVFAISARGRQGHADRSSFDVDYLSHFKTFWVVVENYPSSACKPTVCVKILYPDSNYRYTGYVSYSWPLFHATVDSLFQWGLRLFFNSSWSFITYTYCTVAKIHTKPEVDRRKTSFIGRIIW